VNGATLTADRNGNANGAYSFDGVDDYIHINNLNTNTSDFTLNLWVSVYDYNYNNTAQQSLIYLGTEAGSNLSQTHTIDFTIDPINYNPPFLRASLNYDYGFCGSQNSNNLWQCITAVLHGNSQQLEYFINGVSVNLCSVNVNGIIIQSNDVNNIGAGWHFTNLVPKNYFFGQLDDIAIYNRALTQEEITALYTGTTNGGGGGNGGTAGTPAQSVPQGIPYQAMIRDNNGAALINTPVTVRFSLRQDAIDGTVEYQETHNLTTNAFGLINTHFGTGTATQGTFANINWSNTTKFIQVEANTGAGYVDMGTQQMMSVPFALKANKANAVQNAGLPVFANNAAALAGGLVAGDMYRTAAGALYIVY
jgi:hypothetical protein